MEDKPLNLLCFAFYGTNTQYILNYLTIENKRYLKSHKDNLDQFLDYLIKSQPPYILGLGQYSGRDQSQIRIETKCSNKFKNHLNGEPLTFYDLCSFVASDQWKSTVKMGNSYCNYVSFIIMQAIQSGILHSKYSFLHIPKALPKEIAIIQVNYILNQINGLRSTL